MTKFGVDHPVEREKATHVTASPNSNVNPTANTPNQIAGSVLPLKAAEELLSTLADVVSARIVASVSGEVETIHVLVTGDLSPKQMVRNIESALMAQLGMRVDHRKISVATTTKRPAPAAEPVVHVPIANVPAAAVPVMAEAAVQLAAEVTSGRLLYFEDVETRGSRAKGVTCRVTLRRVEDRYVGEAEGMESDRSRMELSARATLAAIGMSETGDRKLSLEGVKVVQAFDQELVLVSVHVRQARTTTQLTGSCVIKDSIETASALAVLNATNRWVESSR